MDWPVVAVVCANNRPDYLAITLLSMGRYLPPIPVIIQNDGDHNGMAHNVQQGFDRFLQTDAEYCWWQEDDMELIAEIPLDRMTRILETDPKLAHVVAKRHPWSSREHELGDVIAATCEVARHSATEDEYTVHDHIFSLNPCLIPRHIMELGYDSGNEAGMTEKLLALGYQFAFYGTPGDPPLVNHIGQERGEGWKL